jgi:alkaline phosphatase
LENIPEIVVPKGYVAGVVTTDNISGATPAAFFAHQPSRTMAKEILLDLLKSPLSLIAGGSMEHFAEAMPAYEQLLPKSDFVVINDYNLVPQNKNAKKIALITNKKDSGSKKQGRGDYLPVTTKNAIDFLASKPSKGFFLMVEGAKIDGGGHANDLEQVVTETLDFDKAVTEALKFADINEKTLVIVLADHETGGMSITGGDIASSTVETVFTSKGHTPVLIPVFAYGPSSDQFKGVMENNEVMKKIVRLLQK